jgi:hypothetical protein
MDKTDLSLLLSALCALDIFLGAVAAVVIVAFAAGVLSERHRRNDHPKPNP